MGSAIRTLEITETSLEDNIDGIYLFCRPIHSNKYKLKLIHEGQQRIRVLSATTVSKFIFRDYQLHYQKLNNPELSVPKHLQPVATTIFTTR